MLGDVLSSFRVPKFWWFVLAGPAAALASTSGGCSAGASKAFSTASGGAYTVSVTTAMGGSVLTIGTGGSGAGMLVTACSADAGCGGDLLCLTATTSYAVFGGGAPNGFCTKACSSDSDCASLGGVCYKMDPTQNGACTLPCTLDHNQEDPVSEVFAPLSNQKCLGRPDVRCARLGATMGGVCLPTCGDDAECAGRSCDPRTAVCVDTPNTGAPLGAPCDPTADAGVCAGLCVGFQNGSAMCSDPCVVGGFPDAGITLPYDCHGADAGLCAFHPSGYGPGDTGYCTPACTTQSACQNPNFWCFGVSQLTPSTHLGYCFAAAACPNGQIDCEPPPDAGDLDAAAADGGYLCTATPLGPFCLDPTFPLGFIDAGLGDGGDAAADGGTDATMDASEGG
jgi:hypothetical protein